MPGEPTRAGQRAVTLAVALVVLALGLWPEPLLAIGEQAGRDLVATGGRR